MSMRRKQDEPKSESVKKKVCFDEKTITVPLKENRVNRHQPKLFRSPPHADYNRLKQLIYSRLRQEQIAELNRDLETYGVNNNVLKNFFEERGRRLLTTATLITKDTRLLTFIFDKISPQDIQIVIQKDNYSLLQNFLTFTRELVKEGIYTASEEQLRIEKLTILLRLSEVKDFITKNKEQLPIATQQEFNEAMKKITEPQEYPSPKL